ncbi:MULTISPECIES: alkyl/aryl-sulfatase [unclassified Pseudomonas]|uniref:alkyl/aryl-sulfatase n=1 Tax=unclassified Pseudomonas TaxID=196821 RepID=UPI000B73A613|nr:MULTISPECIES: alkyl sulfatase dimerization domain-containing protein [Pseudomonas]SNT50302.1 Alkyl sulfatase BDS1, metallo-beta-lactamase superfamily [Pseudomonas sp. LAMO17WK12:I8]SNY43541.1 Alkyl sulfatase BDS1, metallo-beta-lactamase superfamily [Pseudomonas sp. LAMO17WK12:I11]SNY43573.1 Alkyl sulfatase BDS1, metallo-beta-lactamase superfamily [Pseudomonas sp. LAMO17WK12:I7]SNY43625.1 Alkyl sulfatase BDS1, metallo-beta-lactamase superfamily [Pseudomonas sp. LAMO17WK12:I12]
MRLRTLPCLLALPFAALADGPAKDATDLTRQINQQWLQRLPFADRSDFDNARRGLLEAVDKAVVNADGKTVWDLQRYAFLKGEAPATVNPSLWRIAQLNTLAGLFKVTDRIYQVRGLDLANMTLIEGEHGLIVMDPLLSVETARAGLAMYFRHRPQRPVVAVIYTHPHVDHFGGVRGVIDEDEVKAGKVQVIAPQGFFEHAISENVLAGPAMKRRAQYMYGAPLPRGPRGQVDAGLGKGVPANATVSLIAPTRLIEQPFETLRIDGIDIEFQLTPGTEAPAEMNLWFPQFKALCMAENASHVQHNVLTLRGAQVRDAKVWAHYLDQSLLRYGEQAEVVFAQHHWPTWGGAAIRDYLADQRDMYAFIDSQTLRLINRGLGPTEIAAELTTLPPRLASKWYSRDYYGSLSHNVRAVYQRYMGFYDGNPATLNPLPPSEAGAHYVKAMGGADRVLTLAREAYASGDYRWVAELTRHLVFAQPDNGAARELQADALEQLGYQSENATWRNAYLAGAQELRNGVAPAASKGGSADDLVRALTPTLFFDYLGVRVDAGKAAEQDLTINWRFTDLNEDYALTLRNGVLTHRDHTRHRQADVEVNMSKATLDRIALKQTGFLKEATVGDIDISGERMKFMRFMAALDEPDGRFNIVTP